MLRGFQKKQSNQDRAEAASAQACALAMSRRSLNPDARARIEAAWAGFEAAPPPHEIPLHGSLPPLQPARRSAADRLQNNMWLRQTSVALGLGARWALILMTVVALVFVGRTALASVTLPEVSLGWLRVVLPLALLGGLILVLLRIGRGLLEQFGFSLPGARGIDPFDRLAAQLHDQGTTPR